RFGPESIYEVGWATHVLNDIAGCTKLLVLAALNRKIPPRDRLPIRRGELGEEISGVIRREQHHELDELFLQISVPRQNERFPPCYDGGEGRRHHQLFVSGVVSLVVVLPPLERDTLAAETDPFSDGYANFLISRFTAQHRFQIPSDL